MGSLKIWAAAISSAVISATSLAQAQTPGVTVFEGARLIIGDGQVVESASLVVQGDRILQAGPASQIRPPNGARRVSLAGKTVMPMLIDTHVHTSTTPETLTQDLKRRAVFGVAAVMSMGSDPFAILPMRNPSVAGGARYFSAGRGITRPEQGRSTTPYWINTAEEARAAVRELAAQKVDIVKIWIDDRAGAYQKLTPDQFGAIIDEAHKNGLRVSAHIHALSDIKAALRLGVDALAHSVRDQEIDEEGIALMRARPDLVVNPNMPARGVKTDLTPFAGVFLAAEARAAEQENTDLPPAAQAIYAFQARTLARMNAAGTTIVLGTDGNRPWAPHVELEDMVVAGLTPMQAIVAGTRNAAQFLRIADAGTLAPGKSADFIVLDANPLDGITNTRRISAVYLRGTPVDRTTPPAP